MNTKQLMGKNANYDSICPNNLNISSFPRALFFSSEYSKTKEADSTSRSQITIRYLKHPALQHKPETQGRGRTRPPDGWMRIGGRDETVIRPHHQSSRFLSLSTRCCICSSLTTIWVTEKRIQ